MSEDFRPAPVVTVAAGFAFGALLTWLLAEAVVAWRRRPTTPAPIADDILRRRVRERMSELSSRPDAIEVEVDEGVVRLSGQVLPHERDRVLSGVQDLPGVLRVRSALSFAGDLI